VAALSYYPSSNGEGLKVEPASPLNLMPTPVPFDVAGMCDVDASSFPSVAQLQGADSSALAESYVGMCLTSNGNGAAPYKLTGPYLLESQRGRPKGGTVPLGADGLIDPAYLPSYFGDPIVLRGTWDALANAPALAPGVGAEGDFYFVIAAGLTYLGPGACRWNVGDGALFDGTQWVRVAYAEPAAYDTHSNGGHSWNESSAYPYQAYNASVVPAVSFVDGLLVVADAPWPRPSASFARTIVLPSAAEIVAANPYAGAGNLIAFRLLARSFANDLVVACGANTRMLYTAYPPFTTVGNESATGLPTRVSLATGYWALEFNAVFDAVSPAGSASVTFYLESASILHDDPYDPAWSWSITMASA
jgi:hypothetical protein